MAPPPPPHAGPCLPLLGNALHFRADPPGFLLAQVAALGPVFTLNLAGFRTTLVCEAAALRAFAAAPASVLSVQQAVADFGFRHTLGELNVYHGARVHKDVLVSRLYPLAAQDPGVRACCAIARLSSLQALLEWLREWADATLCHHVCCLYPIPFMVRPPFPAACLTCSSYRGCVVVFSTSVGHI